MKIQKPDQTKYVYDSEHANFQIAFAGQHFFLMMLDATSLNGAAPGSIPSGHDFFEVSMENADLVPPTYPREKVYLSHNGMGCSQNSNQYSVVKADVVPMGDDNTIGGRPSYEIKDLVIHATRSKCDGFDFPLDATITIHHK